MLRSDGKTVYPRQNIPIFSATVLKYQENRLKSTVEAIKKIITRDEGLSADEISIVSIAGDASQREFFRVRLPDGGTRVAMQMEGPLPAPDDPDQVPYINILYHLTLCKAAVPRLHQYDPASGILILEDLGDVTLESYVADHGVDAAKELYKKAIDELLTLQIIGTRKQCTHCMAFHHSFDEAKLMWELDFFLTHTVKGQFKRDIPETELAHIRCEFHSLCRRIAAEPRYFTHRDYHSRNLMVRDDGRIGIVDFQDARLGPLQYDLCSLLRDAYVVLPDKTRDDLISYYIEARDEMEGTGTDREAFRTVFDMVSVQRCLKAAGTFGYMATIRMRESYLQYLPNTFHYVQQILWKYPELNQLRSVLGRHLPEIV
jgi:aminoglycoside/choline kinase family phosphotransferase